MIRRKTDNPVKDGAYENAQQRLASLHLPIGWQSQAPLEATVRSTARDRVWSVASPILGWLVTAFAVTLGAPFWFDILNRVMVIRSTVKPREKSGEESSKDAHSDARVASLRTAEVLQPLQPEPVSAESCAGHKEYAPTRKQDPTLDMVAFRQSVAAIIAGTAPAPVLIPAAEPPAANGAIPGRPTLRRGATGTLVEQIQRKLRLQVDGQFGPATEATVRSFQRDQNLVPDGIVGPKTWAALDKVN